MDRSPEKKKEMEKLILELSKLWGERFEVTRARVELLEGGSMCLHCVCFHIKGFLSENDFRAYDLVWPERFWCKCIG